ncbi:MAG: pentapeptide repeat-containing protein [Candidatus Electrothrix scaldis]|nr:MAG: pentapeptide repeat-containing protein [Candidatus Electrothrix sp. GW3-3]
MANPNHLEILSKGTEAWNRWRLDHLKELPDLSESTLIEFNFSKANFSNTNFTLAELIGSSFSNANLSNADLSGADLRYANFTDANLTGASLKYAILVDDTGLGADLTRAVLKETRFSKSSDTVESGNSFFLDLACTTGLETADFGNPTILNNYLIDTFEYAHIQNTADAETWPKLLEKAIQRIKSLRSLFSASSVPPTGLIQVVKTINAEIIKQLAHSPTDLYTLSPRGFEELIAEVLSSYGWEVVLTPATKDGGYDLFAITKNKSGLQASWIIES